jgi:hypothetical protein
VGYDYSTGRAAPFTDTIAQRLREDLPETG